MKNVQDAFPQGHRYDDLITPTLVFHFIWIFAAAYLQIASSLGPYGHLSACPV
jgi:hypothetical protein